MKNRRFSLPILAAAYVIWIAPLAAAEPDSRHGHEGCAGPVSGSLTPLHAAKVENLRGEWVDQDGQAALSVSSDGNGNLVITDGCRSYPEFRQTATGSFCANGVPHNHELHMSLCFEYENSGELSRASITIQDLGGTRLLRLQRPNRAR